MNKHNAALIFCFTMLVSFNFLVTGCVSVKIGNNEIKKATDVIYKEPAQPFVEFESAHLDAAWRNSSNGNSISFLSDCNTNHDPSLDSVQQGILKGLDKVKIIESKNSMYNKRRALLSTAEGEVDGVASKLSLVIFSKNNCLYILTYVGLSNTFSKNKNIFDRFLMEFKAP